MRFPRFIAAALAALLICAGPVLALSPYDTSSTVTASTTHQSVALASPALAVEAFNAGAVVAYVELGGTAASSTGIPLQPCSGKRWTFPAGRGPASVGVITASSTASVTITGYYDLGSGSASGPLVEHYVPAVTCSTPTWSTVTVTGLTSGRVPIISTGGLLADDADLTFATDTLTATKLEAGTVSTTTANGASWTRQAVSESITLSTSGATTDSTADLLPANSIIKSVVCRVTTTVTTATDWKVGDATTSGRFAAANSTMTAGSTSVGLVHMFGNVSTTAAGPSQAAAAKLRITTTGTPGAGVIRCTVFSEVFVAPTS